MDGNYLADLFLFGRFVCSKRYVYAANASIWCSFFFLSLRCGLGDGSIDCLSTETKWNHFESFVTMNENYFQRFPLLLLLYLWFIVWKMNSIRLMNTHRFSYQQFDDEWMVRTVGNYFGQSTRESPCSFLCEQNYQISTQTYALLSHIYHRS